jgi:glycosyltransferase involved in cell wall biosynthesis
MNNELISIIIPVFNNEKYFERCISSVINQTYKNIEIIIINDCSTDNVEKIILKYKELDNRIIYEKNTNNMGVGYSRNRGIDLSNGKYIYFLDSDDYIKENTIELLYKTIKPNDSYCCMLSGFKEVDGVVKSAKRSIEELELLKSPSVCIRLFNKDIILKSNIRFSNLRIAEDLEFIFKILLYNSNVSYLDEALYTYVIHNDSSLRRYTDNQLDTLKAIDSVCEYAKEIGKYDENKEKIEYVAVDHILVGTINRIMNTSDYKMDSINKCIDYINNNFPDWKENKFVLKYILSNNAITEKFKKLNII